MTDPKPIKNKPMLRHHEEVARLIISEFLGEKVEQHDDGNQPSMYDLRVGPADNPAIAIECVRAVDALATETWNLGPAKGPFDWSPLLKSDWDVGIKQHARIDPLTKALPSLLQELESRTIHKINMNHYLKRQDRRLYDLFTKLEVTDCSCFRLQGNGKVQFWTEGYSGGVDYNGSEISKWLAEFLNHHKQKDIVFKLKKSQAKQTHVFITVDLGGANWLVDSYLTTELEFLPSETPVLPKPINAVWLLHSFSEKGIFWNGNTWQVFTLPKNHTKDS